MDNQSQPPKRARERLYEAAKRGELRARSETDVLIGRSSWLAMRQGRSQKIDGPSRQYAPITVSSLESSVEKGIYKEPSEEVDFHSEIGEKRKEAVSNFLEELETFRRKDHAEYTNLANATTQLLSSFSEYIQNKKDRKISLNDIKSKFQNFRDEIYHILLLEGYELRDIRDNLVNIEQAFQEVQIQQTDDPELKRLMQTVKSTRLELEKFEKQKIALLKSKEEILIQPTIKQKVEKFDKQIDAIAEDIWLEYNEYLNFLADRTKYIFKSDLNFKDEEILNPSSDIRDELLTEKYNYLILKFSLDKANAILNLWESQPEQDDNLTKEQTKNLTEILNSCETESTKELENKLENIKDNIPLDFNYLNKMFFIKTNNIENLEDLKHVFDKINTYLDAITRNPVRLYSQNDTKIAKQYYERWFDDIDHTYRVAILGLTEDIRAEKKRFLDQYIIDIENNLKGIDIMVKDIIQNSFGQDSKLEAVEQAMLTGTNLSSSTESETDRPHTLVEEAIKETGGPIIIKRIVKKPKK